MPWRITVLVALALVLAPVGARAADLVVWWEKGYDDRENEAVREIIAAFEQDSGKQVELDLQSYDDIEAKVHAAVEAGQPPRFPVHRREYGLFLLRMGLRRPAH
jgi:ABC-type glycerol-3-phosphate transport system substrate-binding protein